jgi:hypothetical protein
MVANLPENVNGRPHSSGPSFEGIIGQFQNGHIHLYLWEW